MSDAWLQGKSKKDAKQIAAASALEMLLENVPEVDFQVPGRGARQLKVGAVCGGLVQRQPLAGACLLMRLCKTETEGQRMLSQETRALSDLVPSHCCSLQEAEAEAPTCPVQAAAMAVPQALEMALLSHPQLGAAAGGHQRLVMAAWAHPQPAPAGLPASQLVAVAVRRPLLQPASVRKPPVLCTAAWAPPLLAAALGPPPPLAVVGPHPPQAAGELPRPAQDVAADPPNPAAAACPPPTTSGAGMAARRLPSLYLM